MASRPHGLGTVYMRDIMGIATPVVGLLNVGEEDEKGNAVAREAHQLLRKAPRLNYIGNIEGRDILPGHPKYGPIDVVVCDGFVGNVVLKFYESAQKLLVGIMKRESPEVLKRQDFGRVLTFLDYTEYGGAPLLGVNGVSVIAHGRSDARAIQTGILQSVLTARSEFLSALRTTLSEISAAVPEEQA